jgi:predicted nucleic acid-binding protein
LSPAKVAYLDTNAVIRFIESQDSGLLFLFEQAAADVLHLVTSELTLAEVLVGPLKDGDRQLATIYETFLTGDEILEVKPVDREVLRRSAEVRATLGNKGPDAIHIATALAANCTLLFSSDQRLKLPNGLVQVELDRIHDHERWL